MPCLMRHRKTSASANRTTSQIAFPVVDVVLSPIHTQIAFITPVCCCEGSRAWYMKRQMIPAPMNEIAIGRKISDLAAFSALARSASTATARPNTVASDVTTMTHQMLLKIVPRIEARIGARQDEEAGQDRTERAGTALEGLARPPSGDHADEDAEREQGEGDVEEPAGEDVLPVVEVDRVLVGEDRPCSCPTRRTRCRCGCGTRGRSCGSAGPAARRR